MFKKYGFLMDSAGDPPPSGGTPPASPPSGGTPPAGDPPDAAFDWSAAVPDEGVRTWLTAKGFKDPAALATSALNQEKLLGVPADQIIKLPKDDNPEAWNAVYDRLGRPKTPDEYALPVPEGDKGEFAKEAAKWMHEVGVPGKQGRALAEKWNGFVAAQMKAQTEAVQARDNEQITQLKGDWGAQFDANTKLVDAAAKQFGMDEAQLNALKQAMGPGAAMKFLHSIGSKLGVEGEFVGGDGKGNAQPFNTPETAKARIATLKNDKAFTARFNSSDPVTRQEAREEIKRLHRIAYPGDTLL